MNADTRCDYSMDAVYGSRYVASGWTAKDSAENIGEASNKSIPRLDRHCIQCRVVPVHCLCVSEPTTTRRLAILWLRHTSPIFLAGPSLKDVGLRYTSNGVSQSSRLSHCASLLRLEAQNALHFWKMRWFLAITSRISDNPSRNVFDLSQPRGFRSSSFCRGRSAFSLHSLRILEPATICRLAVLWFQHTSPI